MSDIDDFYRNKTVAITGAGGYIASVLINSLMNTDARILRVSRRVLPPLKGATALQMDVCARDGWLEIVSEADVIFHLAGNTSVYKAGESPSASLNSTVLPITYLVEIAKALGRSPRVVFASTATIYGLVNQLPVNENYTPAPITNYDLHKLFAEKQLELASHQGIIDAVALRLANVYGPSPGMSSAEDRGVLNKITRMALRGNGLKLYGDGNYLRDYVYIDDVVQACIIAGVADGIGGQSFNVGSGKGVTVRDAFELVANKVAESTGKKVSVECVPWPENADPIESRNFIADVNHIRASFGWQSEVLLDEGINRMIDHFNESVIHD